MTAKPENFTDGPLYKKLVDVLPLYVKNPFASEPSLDVSKLKDAVEKSHEAVYKWLRRSRLAPENVVLVVELANRADNVEILGKLGRTPPTINDFNEFVFGRA